MKLYGSLTSPFVRKVRVVIEEKALACTFIRDNPRLPESYARRLSPLAKVPVLELDGGGVLYDSRVIVEYLDSLGHGHLLPSDPAARWTTLRLHALADGLTESAIRVVLEGRRPEGERHVDVVDWETQRIARVLDALEKEPKKMLYFASDMSLADIAIGVALEYVDFRLRLDWRQRLPQLGAWLEPISRRASFVKTAFSDAT
jgi:glutathione S-transferase